MEWFKNRFIRGIQIDEYEANDVRGGKIKLQRVVNRRANKLSQLPIWKTGGPLFGLTLFGWCALYYVQKKRVKYIYIIYIALNENYIKK